MTKWKVSTAALLAVLGAPTVALAEGPIDTKANMEKAAAQWMDAYNKHDAATIANMYSPDAMVSFTSWTVMGRSAHQEAFNKEFPAGVKFTSITVDQSQRIGDVEQARGAWKAEVSGPDGKTTPRRVLKQL